MDKSDWNNTELAFVFFLFFFFGQGNLTYNEDS